MKIKAPERWDLGPLVREERLRRGMVRADLAAELGMSPAWLAWLELGYAPTSSRYAARLEEWLQSKRAAP